LNSIELDLLGDIKGKSVLHLQCHFGQDTISLARLGADATGIDLSDKAIESAKQIAKDANTTQNSFVPMFTTFPIICISNSILFIQVTERLAGFRIWTDGQK
jgi:SAM-dependent methyltransferase